MQYGIWHVERRDHADREALANAALAYCRAVRRVEGVSDCRYYWKPVDVVVIVAEGDSSSAWSGPSADVAGATFDLFDVGRSVGYEEWLDAKSGHEVYLAAGR